MTTESSEELSEEQPDLFVIFSAGGQTFGVPHSQVLEMIQPPSPVPVPGANDAVEGVINLRGHVLGLVDLRSALGMHSATQEFEELTAALHEYERAHGIWIDELIRSTREGEPFRLTTDPHACDFGRWFDAFDPPNEFIGGLVERFGEPYQSLHAVAKEVQQLVAKGDVAQAMELIEDARRGPMAHMKQTFAETRAAMTEMRRDVAIILSLEGRPPLAMRVDAVDAIDSLSIHDPPPSGGAQGNARIVTGVATNSSDELVLLLEPSRIYELFEPQG